MTNSLESRSFLYRINFDIVLVVFYCLDSSAAEQNSCHLGPPDYENLYAYQKSREKVGPEPSDMVSEMETEITHSGESQ